MPSTGIMASAVHIETATCTDVITLEPFNNTSAWTVGGTVNIVAGRTGTAVTTASATGNYAAYTIPAPNESDTITVGFAWRYDDAETGDRSIVIFYSDAMATLHNQLRWNPTGTVLHFTRNLVDLGTASVAFAERLVLHRGSSQNWPTAAGS